MGFDPFTLSLILAFFARKSIVDLAYRSKGATAPSVEEYRLKYGKDPQRGKGMFGGARQYMAALTDSVFSGAIAASENRAQRKRDLYQEKAAKKNEAWKEKKLASAAKRERRIEKTKGMLFGRLGLQTAAEKRADKALAEDRIAAAVDEDEDDAERDAWEINQQRKLAEEWAAEDDADQTSKDSTDQPAAEETTNPPPTGEHGTANTDNAARDGHRHYRTWTPPPRPDQPPQEEEPGPIRATAVRTDTNPDDPDDRQPRQLETSRPDAEESGVVVANTKNPGAGQQHTEPESNHTTTQNEGESMSSDSDAEQYRVLAANLEAAAAHIEGWRKEYKAFAEGLAGMLRTGTEVELTGPIIDTDEEMRNAVETILSMVEQIRGGGDHVREKLVNAPYMTRELALR